MCDLVALYDNTEEVAFRRIAIYKSGEAIRVSSRVPEWYKRNFQRNEQNLKLIQIGDKKLPTMRKGVVGSFLG